MRTAAAILALLFMTAAPSWSRLLREHRTFHPEALAWVADQAADSPEVPTHLRVEGRVQAVRREADGDVHLVLAWNGRTMVAECIPELPEPCLDLPVVGQKVAVWGVHRFDAVPGHDEPHMNLRGWHEVHPVLGWEVVK